MAGGASGCVAGGSGCFICGQQGRGALNSWGPPALWQCRVPMQRIGSRAVFDPQDLLRLSLPRRFPGQEPNALARSYGARRLSSPPAFEQACCPVHAPATKPQWGWCRASLRGDEGRRGGCLARDFPVGHGDGALLKENLDLIGLTELVL